MFDSFDPCLVFICVLVVIVLWLGIEWLYMKVTISDMRSKIEKIEKEMENFKKR